MNRLFAIPVLAAALLLCVHPATAQPRAPACCKITNVDTRSGVVTASVTASGQVFEFTARSPQTIASIRVGQLVHANFANGQVSLDGRVTCCTVTKAPAARAPSAAPTAQPNNPPPRTPGQTTGPITVASARTANLPEVTYGELMPAPTSRPSKLTASYETRAVNARSAGRNLSATVLHVNGPEGIKNAPIPESARRLLEMHRRKLPEKASQYYVINPQLAAQYMASRPAVPAHIKPKDPEKKEEESECGKWSINGVVDCGEDAVDAVKEEFERARKHAEEWWDESTDELEKIWEEGAACFRDHTLPGPRVPVSFKHTPSMTVSMQQTSARGSTGSSVSGSVQLGIPLEADFAVKMEFFYIPCLPFAVRPKRLTGEGSLTVGQELSLDVSATGSFSKRFTLPPTGGPLIPIYVIPIMIGYVPVAVIDVSAYIEGEMDVEGSGKASGQFRVANAHKSTFDFTCDGGGCSGTDKGRTAPTTTNQHAQIDGKVTVKPGLYTALQLNFDYNVLSARAGPQPYLIGIADGCAAVSASQTSGGPSTSQTNAALIADLDWAVKLRAEALAGGQVIGKRWETGVRQAEHLWFRDLAPGGSTALVPSVTTPAQVAPGQPAVVKVRMPSCYPYKDRVHYRLAWDGGAQPAANPACTWQSGGGECRLDPGQELSISLTWPGAGDFNVSAQLRTDDHRRAFSPTPPPGSALVKVAAGGGSP